MKTLFNCNQKLLALIIVVCLLFVSFYTIGSNTSMTWSTMIWKDANSPSDARISLDELNINSLKYFLHGILTAESKVCPKKTHFGRTSADGGYDVCTAGKLAPDPKSCTVLSFGINNEWSFDEGMANHGCYVHSFDPSLGIGDHMHKPKIEFHNLGLGKKNFVNKKNWSMRNILTIVENLKLSEKVVDVIKCDAEGAEWAFLEDVAEHLLKVKQIILEIHSPQKKPHQVTKEDFISVIKLFLKLKRNGYVINHSYQKYSCCAAFSPMMPKGVAERCCHEIYMYNSKYL